MKIFGSTVGTTLPKPSWAQANPKKGDYIKDKPTEMEPVRGYSAYQVAVMNGFEGTEAEWLESLKADTEVVVQEIIKEEYMETIVQEILQPEHTETIIQEIIKPGNVETIVQEIVKEEHVETIVQEILQPENTHTIVQEVLKPENTTVIVEQVMEEIPGSITVEVDTDTMTANYTNTQIIEHLENGGTARVKVSSSGAYFQLYGIVGTTVMFGAPAVNEAEQVELVIYSFWASGSVSKDVFPIGSGEFDGKTFSSIKITEQADGSVTMQNTFTDGTSETIVIGSGDTPSISYNGVEIPVEWVVSQ